MAKSSTEIILEELKNADSPTSLLAERIPSLFAYIDNKKVFQYVNQRFETWFHVSVSDFMGLPMIDLLGKEAFKVVEPRIDRALEGNRVAFEDSVPYQYGGGRLVSIIYSPDIDDKGYVHGVYVLLSDLDERAKREGSLSESYERFELAVKGSNDGIWDIDLVNNKFYYSPRFKELLGYQDDEISSKQVHDSFDELVHPDDANKVYEMINSRVAKDILFDVEYRYKVKSGEYRWFRARGNALKNADGKVIRVAGSLTDINSSQKLTIELEYQASHDMLTKLINRREFEKRLDHAIATAKTDCTEHVIAYLDLDKFKAVNDTAGHIAGDKLLCEIARLMKDEFRSSDIVARIGGDEFALLMHNCNMNQALASLNCLCGKIEEYLFIHEDKSFKVTSSIGVKEITKDCEDITSVITAVETAMRSAKESGRNCVYVYQDEDTLLIRQKGEVSMFYKVNQAIEEKKFVLFYQPIVPLDSSLDSKKSYEILVRMLDEDGSLIPPGAFIPVAERYGISPKLDMLVISKVFSWFGRHPEYQNSSDICSINLSGLSLDNSNVLDHILEKAHQYKVPTNKICFEITETAVISKLKEANEFINTLREEGFMFSLDDFGSGISSYMYLKALAVDVVKIDGSFVKDMHIDDASVAIVKSINELAHIMGKKTVAEFVENDEIFNRLKVLGVDHGQGYGICKPQPLEEMQTASSPIQNDKLSAAG